MARSYGRFSLPLGPFRVNLSRRGVGWSVGGRGFRTGTSATGRKYSTFSVPGTGMSGRKGGRGLLGCLPMLGLMVTSAGVLTGLAMLAAAMITHSMKEAA